MRHGVLLAFLFAMASVSHISEITLLKVCVFREGGCSVPNRSDHSCLSGRGWKCHKPPCRSLCCWPHLNMFGIFVHLTNDFLPGVSPASKIKVRHFWGHTDGKSVLLLGGCVTCQWLFWIEKVTECKQTKKNPCRVGLPWMHWIFLTFLKHEGTMGHVLWEKFWCLIYFVQRTKNPMLYSVFFPCIYCMRHFFKALEVLRG